MSLKTESIAASTESPRRSRAVVGSGTSARSCPVLAVVVPCYDEELVVEQTAARLSDLMRGLTVAGRIDPSSFIYFVDDGSRDATWSIVEALHERNPAIKGLRLARNVGTQNAVLAGLLTVKERVDCAVTIDADLQQDEAVIGTFLEKYGQGAHIVYGVRRRHDSGAPLKRATSWFFYHLMNLMGARIIKHHSEYRLVSRKALEAIAEYQEHNLFLRGIFVDIGYRSEVVPFEVRRREAGKSKHGLRKLASLALDAITSFSIVPLRVVTFTGAFIFLFSCAMTIFYLYHKLMGHTPPGWAGTIIPIYFLGGVQIMFLGLVGEYIGRIYKEVKARPRFIKDEELD
ncbi:MAG TPA: glycosyltransferase family 2 protein [Pyrinomonadaceae bacterium]|nr:glycosyltransferase family 2 protein [Pyrinomonadaceae bacterium]